MRAKKMLKSLRKKFSPLDSFIKNTDYLLIFEKVVSEFGRSC